MPITSWARRFAERIASPATHAGIARPERKKSTDVRTARRTLQPMPTTNARWIARTA
jgi:hypothetical protein